MYFYRQPIIFFGVVIPFILAVAIIGLGYVMHSKMELGFTVKEETYKAHTQSLKQANFMEAEVRSQRPHLERWSEELSKETASAVGINLKQITDALPNKEIQQTAFDPSNTSGGFGASSAQDASQIRIGFRGTFRTLQKAFLELETRMPQLQLEELSLQPVSTSGYLLTLQVNYTAWHK